MIEKTNKTINSGVSNSCRPTFIYKSDFFENIDEKKKMTAMPRLM